MSFLKLWGHLIRKKDVYFQHENSEKFTGEYWYDGKKIYTKTIRYDCNGSTNINNDIDLGIPSSSVNEIWLDCQNSFVYFEADACSGPLFTVSKSGWYGIYAYLINLTSSGNIKLNIQSNSNTKVNRCYITVRYTKSK